jgi:hypothetical protein
MDNSRTILLRAPAGTIMAIVLAASFACNGVKAPTNPNPGKPLPGMQDMYVIAANGSWDLVGFAPSLTAGATGALTGVHHAGAATASHASASAKAAMDSIFTTFVIVGPPSGTDLVMPTYEAFDQAGNAWMSVRGTAFDGSIVEYTPAAQKLGDTVPPSVAIGGVQYPEGMAFDQAGNLWVLDAQANRLVEYTPAQLAHSGSPAPTSIMSLAALDVIGSTYAAFVLAIDAHGNFWVSANIQNRPASAAGDSLPNFIVAEFTSSQAEAGGTPTPVLTISMPGSFPGGYGPGIAFDSAGNLWTANSDSGTLTKFPASSLTAGPSPLPTIRIGGVDLAGISDVGIDPAGVLFAATGYAIVPGAGLFGYLPSQLTASGSPTPVIVFIPADGITHLATRP